MIRNRIFRMFRRSSRRERISPCAEPALAMRPAAKWRALTKPSPAAARETVSERGDTLIAYAEVRGDVEAGQLTRLQWLDNAARTGCPRLG
jgi:hypothetical protein